MLGSQRLHYTYLLGTFAGLCTIIGTLWQMFGAEQGWSWPWALLLVAVLCLAGLRVVSADSVEMKFRVRRACKAIKFRADRTIDIAAGDCSWLGFELEDLTTMIGDPGVKLRMVCRPTANRSHEANLETLAKCGNADIREYVEDYHLRCIIIDRGCAFHEEMLLLEKKDTARDVLAWLRMPASTLNGCPDVAWYAWLPV